jgi:SagB-type dehydrogenase family enzyme
LPTPDPTPVKQSSISYMYHERIKHSYASVRIGGRGLDWSRKPYPFKYYETGEKLELPTGFAGPKADALASLSCRGEARGVGRIDLNDLASLLFFTGGISRIKRYGGYMVTFRVTPATGALHSTEIYLSIRGVDGLASGLYHFDPAEFTLTALRKGVFHGVVADALADHAASRASLILLLTAVGWRNAWKYGERSYRHWFWDGGAVVANAVSVAAAMGLGYQVYAGFIDEKVSKLLGVDGSSEAPIAVITIEEGTPESYGEGAVEPLGSILADPAPTTAPMKGYEIIEETHRATSLPSKKEVDVWRDAMSGLNRRPTVERGEPMPLPEPADKSLPLGETILARGSARRFARSNISAKQLATILKHGFGQLRSDFLPHGAVTLLYPYMIVNSVDGLPSGAYRYDPRNGKLYLLKKGEFREVAYFLCLEQALARDAAVIFFNMMDLDEIIRRAGDRGYRTAQLEGGIRLGMLYLAAYSVGLGATGLTFYDDDCVEFFSPSSDGLEVSTVVAVGHAAYKSRPGEVITRAIKHPASLL